MNVEEIQSLYGYNRWANDRLRTLAEALPAERTRERLGVGYDSVHSALAHILGAEIVWLSRWRGVSPPAVLGGADFADLAAIRARWSYHVQDQQAFVGALSPAQLTETVRYTSSSGQRWAYPLWQLLVHAVNHGTHHRAELAEMLTRLSSPPPPLDLLVYYDELGGTRVD